MEVIDIKETGIFKCVDDLGRIVIPKEIRRNLGIKEGDALEIFTDDDCVIFKKVKIRINHGRDKCQILQCV